MCFWGRDQQNTEEIPEYDTNNVLPNKDGIWGCRKWIYYSVGGLKQKSLEEEKCSFIVKAVIKTERGVWKCKVLS